nr:hypothetical protein [uncultured Desulfobulbus sp.]
MNETDWQTLFNHIEELRTIGYWLATLLAVNAGLIAANIVSSTIQFNLGRP